MARANAPMGRNAPGPGNAVRQTPPGCQRYAIILRSKLRGFHPFAGLVITRKPSGTEPPLSGGVAFQSSLRVHRGQTLSAESDVWIFDLCRASCAGASSNWRSEEHTSELQSLMRISYAVFCLKKKKKHTSNQIKSYIRI